MSENTKAYKFETLQQHAGQIADPTTGARAVPIYQTTSYVFDSTQDGEDQFALRKPGYIYSRLANPTQEVFEKRIAALEGGTAALAAASGSAAITLSVLNIAGAGDEIVAAPTLYGGTVELFTETFKHLGITARFFNPDDTDSLRAAITDKTKLVYIESLGNPAINIPDFEAIAAIAHANGLPVFVDNTFATPYLFRPLEHGCDIVLHSATKFIGGHGTTLGGIVVDSGKFDWTASGRFPWLVEPNASYHGLSFAKDVGAAAFAVYLRALLLRDTGATISPFNAFLLLQGVETLSLRVERHVENALKVVDYLAKHPQVEKVNHPSLASHPDHALYERYFPQGGISIFTFEVKGGGKAAQKFIDHLKVFSLLANVADVKSLVIHPASTTHSQMNEAELKKSGIAPGTIRLSIGTEHIDDILYDLEQAFKAL